MWSPRFPAGRLRNSRAQQVFLVPRCRVSVKQWQLVELSPRVCKKPCDHSRSVDLGLIVTQAKRSFATLVTPICSKRSQYRHLTESLKSVNACAEKSQLRRSQRLANLIHGFWIKCFQLLKSVNFSNHKVSRSCQFQIGSVLSDLVFQTPNLAIYINDPNTMCERPD